MVLVLTLEDLGWYLCHDCNIHWDPFVGNNYTESSKVLFYKKPVKISIRKRGFLFEGTCFIYFSLLLASVKVLTLTWVTFTRASLIEI